MSEDRVVLATDETTVHLKLGTSAKPSKNRFGNEAWAVESKVLLPGQFVKADELPPYLLEKIESGEAQHLGFVSQSEAEAIQAAVSGEPDDDSIKVQGFPSETEEKKKKVKAAAKVAANKSEEQSE